MPPVLRAENAQVTGVGNTVLLEQVRGCEEASA
jgi:hypothetical protein